VSTTASSIQNGDVVWALLYANGPADRTLPTPAVGGLICTVGSHGEGGPSP